MWFRKSIGAFLSAAVLGTVLWACHVANEEQAFMEVHADSTWTSFDQVAVVLADKNGATSDTLFKGKLTSPDQLKKLPAPGYDGRAVEIILIGFNNGKPAKTETRDYDGHTQTETGPSVVVIIPDSGSVNPGDSSLDIKPDTLRLYVGGATGTLAPAGTAWDHKTLSWNSSDTKIARVDNGVVTPVAPGKVSIRAASGQAKDSSAVTVVLDPPVLDVGTDTAVAINATVAFTIGVRQEYGGVAAFKWSLDGDTQWDDSATGLPADKTVLETPARKFTQAGTFTLGFLVRDGEGNEATATRVLVVSSQVPHIASLDKDAEITVGDSVGFTAKAEVNAGSLKKYVWNYGDGSADVPGTLSGASATVAGGHRYATEGTFKVTFTLEDDAGTSVSASVTVKVDPKAGTKPPVAHAGADTSVNVNTAVRLHGTATDADGTIAKLEWSIDGAAFAQVSGGDTSFVPKTPGSLRCILRATDNDGLTGLDTMLVVVTQSPPPTITAFSPAADTDISIKDSVSFAAKVSGSSPLATYSWDFNGDGVADETGTLTGTTATLKTGKRYATAGTYLVTLKATDQAGNSQTKQVSVLVETDPPQANAGADTAVDAGTHANLHGKATDRLGKIVKTEWKIGASAYVTASPETTITVPAVGGVAINCMLRVTDDDGLQDSDLVVVTVKAATDAALKTLAISSGTLAPVFSAATTTYTASVAEAVSSVTVTPAANSSAATIVVNGSGVVSGTATAAIPLVVGPNTITIVVTAQDLTTKKTYTITVTRLDQTPPTAPTVHGTTPSSTATPTWTWIAGGGGNGNFRFKMDNTDLTTGATATTLLSYTPTTALADGAHTLYVQERDSSGNWSVSGSATILVVTGPFSWYKFDGSLADAGAVANPATATSGTVKYGPDQAAVAGKAIVFDSATGITTGNSPYYLGSTFSVSMWVKPGAVSELIYFIDAGVIGIWAEPGQLGMAVSLPSTNSAGAAVTANTWVHFTGTYDGSNIRCYINGVLKTTTSWPGTPTASVNSMKIGTGSGPWPGSIGDLRFYNRALTQTEITALFNGTL